MKLNSHGDELPLYLWTFGDDYGGGGGSGPSEPEVLWETTLPRRVKDLKKRAARHSEFDHRGLKDDFEFVLWCVLIPHPIADADATDGVRSSASSYLLAQREALGNSLPDDVLLMTRVKKSGAVDFAFAADVIRALNLQPSAAPLLLFVAEPRLMIYRQYEAQSDILRLRAQPLNGIAISLGQCSPEAAKLIIEGLPQLLVRSTVPVDEVRRLVVKAQRTTRMSSVTQTAKTYAGPVISIISGAITIGAKLFR